MACSALGHKNGNGSTVSPAAVVVAALFPAVSSCVRRLIQLPPNCPFQLKDISVAEHGNRGILLSVQESCGSENKQALTRTILFTFSSQFVKEKIKTSLQCFLPFLNVYYI